MKPRKGQAPYGFSLDQGRLLPKPEEAETRRKAFALFRDLRNKSETARKLNEDGHRTRRQNEWTGVAVGRLLACHSAVGRYTPGGSDGDKTKTIKCDPIVTDDLWEQVQGILREQATNDKRKRREPTRLFADCTFCECGEKMYVPSGTPKYVCRSCLNKIPIEDLDQTFLKELNRLAPTCNLPASLPDTQDSWNTRTFEEKRHTVTNLIDKFVIIDGRAHPRFKFSRALKELPKIQHSKAPTHQNAPGLDPNKNYIRLPSGKDLCPHTGLKRSYIYTLITASEKNEFKPPVDSVKLVSPGKTRGVRWVDLDSLKTYIRRHATSGGF